MVGVFPHVRDWRMVLLCTCATRKGICTKKDLKKRAMRTLNVADAWRIYPDVWMARQYV